MISLLWAVLFFMAGFLFGVVLMSIFQVNRTKDLEQEIAKLRSVLI